MSAIRKFWPYANAQMDAMKRIAEVQQNRLCKKRLGGVVVSVRAYIVNKGYARWMYSWSFDGSRMSEASIRLAFAQLFEQRKLTGVAREGACDVEEGEDVTGALKSGCKQEAAQ